MKKTAKYELPEDILTVSENLDAATADMILSKPLLSPMQETDDVSMEIPSLQYSLEELNGRISQGIERYHRGEYYTQEEAHAFFDKWMSRV